MQEIQAISVAVAANGKKATYALGARRRTRAEPGCSTSSAIPVELNGYVQDWETKCASRVGLE